MLQWAIMNMLEQIEKMKSLSIEIEGIKKNQMEILDLKNTIAEIKSSTDGLNSRMVRTKERINKLEDRTIEIIQSEQQRGNGLKNNE